MTTEHLHRQAGAMTPPSRIKGKTVAAAVQQRRPRVSRGLLIRALSIALIAALLILWIKPVTIMTNREELLYDLRAHLYLVGWSMLAAIVSGLLAGIVLSRPGVVRYADRLMQVFNIGNTIPSLAVLVLALAVLGIGNGPALLALWLASVLPITRNTYEGLRGVSPSLREAAKGIGMTRWQSLFRVELQNALPMIFGGVRTALAINVGTAPLAFLIGADSLGTLIFPGIYLNQQPLLLLGAATTAVVALILDVAVASLARFVLGRLGLGGQGGMV